MKRAYAIAAGLLVLALTVFGCAHHPSAGWVTLIDGNDGLANWNRIGGANWTAADGAIQADKTTSKEGSRLVSKKSYKDFELYAEFWASADTNSGIYIRCADANKISTANAYEVQIWDKNPDQANGTGALMRVATVSPMPKAGGRWNTFEIYARGSQFTVKMNGAVTVHAQDSKFAGGPIALQFTSGPIKWRKVLIKEL